MYENIKQQFREVIKYSQCIPDPQVDDLFNRWQDAKQKFIDRFGGLIYEWSEPVEFTLGERERKSKAMDLSMYVEEVFHNTDLSLFIEHNLDSFYDNRVSVTDGKKIPEGMKLIKAFKYFESDKRALRDIQDMASCVIQSNKIKGTLCFSVHPLDFLSSSENTYNWRSCHALDGEYRSGNLSYMVDNTTFMVYLKGADDVYLNSFGDVKWNSKKWRMLIHASERDEIMFAGRQYPIYSTDALDQVLNIYNNLMYGDFGYRKRYYGWQTDYIEDYTTTLGGVSTTFDLEDKYFVYNGRLYGMFDAVKPGPEARNYNDLLFSTCYTRPAYTFLSTWEARSYNPRENPLIVGGEVMCLHCGQRVITDPETMRCDHCEMNYGYEENDAYGSCSVCGARIYLDDAPYVGDYDEPVCDSCYHTECFICEECGETHFKSDKHYIRLDDDEEETEKYVCAHCYEEYQEE